MSKQQKMLINNYNKIRNITRTVYLYGIYNNRQMYPVSDRKLSNEKLRIKHLYKNHYKSEFYNNKKYIGLFYDKVYYSRNFMAKSYFIKTFTNDDFILYFSLLEILSDEPRDIDDILDEFYNKRDDGEIISKSTFIRKINELNKEDIIQKVLITNKYYYKLKEEFFKDFSTREKQDLLHMVMFFVGITPYKVPGYYLMETLKNYSDVNFNNYYDDENSYLEWFSYENNCVPNILDEIVLYDIEKNKAVKIINDKMECDFFYQYKITDNTYGRIYVLGKIIKDNKVTDRDIIFRLDRIEKVIPLKTSFTIDKIKVNDLKIWNASLDPYREEIKLEKVQAIFYIDEEEKYYLIEKINMEKQWGTFERIAENKFLFTIEVSDSMEMIPWFRSYEGYVVVLNDKIRDILIEEREEMIKVYSQ